MSTDDMIVALVYAAAPAQTAFLVIYGSGVWSKWWRSLVGRALFTKALGLALLLDLSLVGQWFGTYPHQEQVGLVIISVVCLGAYLQLAALLVDMRTGSRHRFSDENRTPQGRVIRRRVTLKDIRKEGKR